QIVLVKALENQDNKVFHYCFTKNITERKQAEETLKTAQETLEKEVEKRTLELQSANLKLLEEIAERKRIEEVLRENQERSALILKGTNDGIWDWNLLTNEIYYSERWIEILGYTEIEISHNSEEWLDRIHPEDIQRVKTELKAHLEGFTPQFESEHRILHKDHGYMWVLTRGFAVTDEQGEPYRIIGSLKSINTRKIVEEQLRNAAFYDRLTNLPNRLLFMERLQHTLSLTKRRDKYQFGVLFLDLDRFKVINESLGHSNGDELLIWMAAKIKSCLLPGDTVARIGGDEFAILLEDIEDINDTITVAEKIQGELKTPFCINGHEVFTTVSIGITVAGGGEKIDESYYQHPENFLRDADIAMYRSKALGKARYEIFNPEMHSQAVALLKLEIDLRRAIERKEFILNYQPIVDLKTGELLGFEALIRWQHPERGFISPLEFIPVAEETGLIVPIGLWVLEQSCQQMQFWQENVTACTERSRSVNSSLTISVNLSVKQFDQSNQLVEQIKAILHENKCDAENLKLEITETLLMENKDTANQLLFQLKGLGIELNMDDFGTGYSSLSYLHRFPIDTLKIDRAFINLMGNNAEDSAIVNTIITLAHNLDMTVTAEGVETVEQLIKLQLMGCDYGQGYYFSRPVNKEKATELIKQNSEFRTDWQINWNEAQLKLAEKINAQDQELENTKRQLNQVIDQKVKLAAELQNSEQLYRYVIQTASEGIWIINTESKTTFVNEKMSEMLGYTIEEMRDKHLFDFMEQEAQILATEYLEHRIYGINEQHDFKFRCKNGSPAWAWLNTTPILDENGKYAGVLAMITDITERKKAEITLKQQTERERLITQITQKIRESLDLETILNTTVAEVRQFLCTDRVVIYKFNPDWSGNIIIESVENSQFSILGRQIHDICFDEKYVQRYQEGRIKAIADIYTAQIQSCHRNLLAQYQVRANLIVPIIQKQNLWGLLIAHHCTDVKNWQEFEIELLRQLATQLTIAIQQSELYQELQLANQELHRLATSDGLTKVANRRSFDQYLEQQWMIAKQKNQYLSLILCDIDFFKLYNDTYGHQAGDECLQKVAKTISDTVRSENDLAARYGGEEFAIILPHTKPEEAILVAERIRSVLIQLRLPHKSSKISDYITLSMGVASIIPQDNLSSSMLIYKADQALYQAKSSGRNCVKLQTLEI
ncbi:MAG TPA: diguanylate cyclase, partial [Allocoleopsis sp.]